MAAAPKKGANIYFFKSSNYMYIIGIKNPEIIWMRNV